MRRFYSHFVGRARLLLVAVVLSSAWIFSGPSPQDNADADAVNRLCAGERCPVVTEGTFRWVWPKRVAESGPMSWHPAVFLAYPVSDEPRDLFVADFRVTSRGTPRDIRRLTNLTRTAAGDEETLACASDGRVAFGAKIAGTFNGVTILDFNGEPERLTADWSKGWKLANSITNFQWTGRTEGVSWKTYMFHDLSNRMDLRFETPDWGLIVKTSSDSFRIDRSGGTGASDVIVQEMVKGRPALLAWLVDTIRAVQWVGRRKIEWLEKIWFDLNDWMARARYQLVGEEQGEETMRFASFEEERESVGIPGWPPDDLDPVLKRSRSGEGVWIPVRDEAFIPATGGPPLFYETYMRTDKERLFSKVFLAAWDPSTVELRIMAGVREPISSTGLRGSGEVPREDVDHLVAAFNGAFQALHGEWGMVLDRKDLLPPRAYGATVAVYDDGGVAMGTWPHPVIAMPDGMKDLRQNVHPLVEGGEFNPYRRKWWGGVPEGVDERVVTARSGICLTFGGKLIYFWGQHLSPESLGAAMVAAGCDYGIHLDMNVGHCGFEYYRVDRVGDQIALHGDLRRKTEAQGLVPRRPDLFFRARKMVSDMEHMRFPRYIARDPRDFFYLLRKPSIFDRSPIIGSDGEDTGWSPLGSRKGYPVPAVVASVGDEGKLYRFDPGQVRLFILDERPKDALLAIPFVSSSHGIATGLILGGREERPWQSGEPGLDLEDGKPSMLDSGSKGKGETAIQGVWPAVARLLDVQYALGVDPEGYLVAACANGIDDLVGMLEGAGAEKILALIHPDTASDERVRWLVVRSDPVAAWKRIFKDVKPVPETVWRKVFKNRSRLLDHDDE